MSVFDLDTRGQADLAEAARANPIALGDTAAPVFRGIFKGIGTGFMRGGAEAADTLQTLGRFFDEPGTDQQATDDLAADIHHSSVDYWTPGPAEVGKAGQMLGGLSEIALPLMATAGNPALLVGTETNKVGKQLVDQGVDAGTATKAAIAEGASTAVGFKLPFLGRSLVSRMATGAAGNLAVGAGTAAAEHGILESGGYKDLAAQYNPGDLTSRAIDALTGVAFGGVAHLQMRPSEVDAVATAANAKHFQNDTAPGHPADVAADVAHQQAMESAIEQTLKGEPVSTPDAVTQADFVPRERNASVEGRSAAAHENGMAQDADAVHAEYVASQLEDAAPGYTVQEGDTHGTEAFQGLRSDVQTHEDVGGNSGGVSERQGRANDGGPGSGANGEPLTVYRGSHVPLAPEHFAPEALGKSSEHPSSGLGVFFTNNPEDAARYGPIVSANHLDIRNPKVFRPGELPGFDSIEDATRFREALRAAGHDGITLDYSSVGGPVQHVAFEPRQVIPAHETASVGSQGIAAENDWFTGESAPAKAPGAAEAKPAKTAAVNAAEQAASEADFKVATVDAAGNTVVRSARELLAEADAGIAQAQNDAKGIEAAVGCFLRRGE